MNEFGRARTEGGSVDRDLKPARLRVRAEALPGGGPHATRRALASLGDARAIVLVEGISDQIALETLAARRGRDLVGEGISIVPIGGAQAIQSFLIPFGPQGVERDAGRTL